MLTAYDAIDHLTEKVKNELLIYLEFDNPKEKSGFISVGKNNSTFYLRFIELKPPSGQYELTFYLDVHTPPIVFGYFTQDKLMSFLASITFDE